MPPAPTFDYYIELELERSASSQEITSSFRRLAMIHHPDRNQDNQQEATARFQRLQLAYETLSDPSKRSRYDNTRPTASSRFFNFDDDDDDDACNDGNDDPYDFFQQFPFEFAPSYTFDYSSRSYFNFSYENIRTRYEEVEELRRLQEQYRENLRQQRRRREEEEEARLTAQRAAKRNAAIAKETQKSHQHEDEKEKQQRRWKELNSVTKDERLAACLHSDFCKKIQQQKKFKCSACLAKRGLIAFECPYCSAFLCQLCVAKFSGRRKRLDKAGGPNVTARGAPSQNPQDHPEDLDPANNDKAANEDGTTSANSLSPQENTKSKKNKKFKMKNSPEPTKAQATETTARDDPIKSNQEATAAAEPQEATALPVPQQNKKPMGAGNSSYQKATVGPDVVNEKADSSKDDKSQTVSQDPEANPKPTLQPKNPPSTTRPTPGSTRGFIRNTMPIQGAPEALLRQAMEQFGMVSSLKVKNKYVGTAHVEFANHSGLCKAMAASPVVVNDQVSIEVVELKECSECGRFGHIAGYCRIVKAPGRRGRR